MLTLAAVPNNEPFLATVAIVLGVLTAIFVGMYIRERNARSSLEQRFAGFMNEIDDRRTNESRNNVMFEQQKQLNDMMAAKFQAELRLLVS